MRRSITAPRLPRGGVLSSTGRPLGRFDRGGSMRKSTFLVLLLLAGCAPLGRLLAPSPLSISPDGRTVTAGKETWTTPDEVLFYQRGDVLHVVSTSHGRSWDVAVPIGADGRLEWPKDAPFEAAGGELKLRVSEATPEIAQL